MLVSLKWLNQYVKVDDLDSHILADKISLHSVEVEQVSKVSDATGIVVGYVEKKEQHPDADKLTVCQVNLGSETVQIVCGAANVDAGQLVPVATNGALLPGGFKIKKTKIRGQVSNGMICSATELGIAPHHVSEKASGGIWVLPKDAPVGADAISYLGLDDWIIELGLTPNRMDMLSMYGIAYDVAAITHRTAKQVPKSIDIMTTEVDFTVKLATEKASTYLAKIVNNVRIESSHFDIEMKLMATGNKPINNIVDLTNEIMLTTGIPIHAFDIDKLPAKEIIVRDAVAGEQIVTLDGQTRLLEAGDIVITSGDQIVAIAGVMGCTSSAIDENTKNVLFEAAIFNPTQIRKTATRLNLRTNASARFEKGIHIDRIFEASRLIDEVFENVINVKAGDFKEIPVEIKIACDEINAKLGTCLTTEEIESIFDRLNLKHKVASCEAGNAWYWVTPSTRMLDVRMKDDLIEEIARIYGFNNLPATLPAMNTIGGLSQVQKAKRMLHKALQAVGLQNVVTYSLVNESKLSQFLPTKEIIDERVSLSMPLSLDHAHLRKSLIPSLLEVIAYNKARQIKDVFIYEIGKIHFKDGDNYTEKEIISGALSGEIIANKWQGKVEKVDFYLAKGVVDVLISTFGFEASYAPITDGYTDFHPGLTATVAVCDKVIGVVGKLHPNIKKIYDVNDTFVFELDLEALFSFDSGVLDYKPVSVYPQIALDIAIITDETIPVSALVDTIKKTGGKLLESVEVFDIYTGDSIPEGKKSVAINLYYQNVEKTLTDDDVNPIHAKVLKSLASEHGATLRVL